MPPPDPIGVADAFVSLSGELSTRIPFLGRNVIFGCNSILCPPTRLHPSASVAGNLSECQNGFHPRKRFPYALPSPSAERKIRKPWPPHLRLSRKSLRTKLLRLRKPSGISLHDVLAEKNHGSLLQPIRPDRYIFEHFAPHRPGRRVKAHRFRQHHRCERQPLHVFECRQPIAKHRIQFRMKSARRFRILTQKEPRPAQRVGHRFISGEKQCEHLVAQLLHAFNFSPSPPA